MAVVRLRLLFLKVGLLQACAGQLVGPTSGLGVWGVERIDRMKPVRVFLAGVTVLLLAVGGLVASDSALAAPGNGIDPGTIVITRVPAGNANDQLKIGDTVRVEADWAVPRGTPAGYQFSMGLPGVFVIPVVSKFDLQSTEGPAGSCIVQGVPPVLTCTLNDFAENRDNVHGSVWVEVLATGQTTNNTVNFTVDGQPYPVTLPGSGGIGPKDETPGTGGGGGVTVPTNLLKMGIRCPYPEGRLCWYVDLPASVLESGPSTLDVVDRISPDGDPHRFPQEQTPQVKQACNGYSSWQVVSSGYSYEISRDGLTIEWKLSSSLVNPAFSGGSGKCALQLTYVSLAVDGVFAGDQFRNTVSVAGREVGGLIKVAGNGGGNAGGDRSGTFTVSKSVAGAAASSVDPATMFTLHYTAPGYPESDLFVPADGTPVSSPSFSARTKVTIEEVDLPPDSGVLWGTLSLRSMEFLKGKRQP